ncbi:MAG: hypothetical protein PHR06_07355 [Candidatus Cloacimonetes bacterium]|nr:hypothetical protein [Candidatus Cloacimonadota bacterium]
MKRIVYTIGLTIYCLVMLGQTATAPSLGDGTSGSPYQIASLENLYWIAALDAVVSSPNSATRWTAHYIQTTDIDASSASTWFDGKGWQPIGYDPINTGTTANKFSGVYNGNGYKITGLRINRPLEGNIGLFGHFGSTTSTTTIKNVRLEDVVVVGGRGTGTLVGKSYRTTSNNY